VNCRHLSKSATGVCSVSVGTSPRAGERGGVPGVGGRQSGAPDIKES
jgi:hypothetical protein